MHLNVLTCVASLDLFNNPVRERELLSIWKPLCLPCTLKKQTQSECKAEAASFPVEHQSAEEYALTGLRQDWAYVLCINGPARKFSCAIPTLKAADVLL